MNYSCAGNPWHTSFDIQSGNIFNNNIPLIEASSTSIPTLNEWGMIIFCLLLGGAVIRHTRPQSLKM
ncbi:MAG TPA: IPTL-CTERM sorting domain-containing protein [Proteobacteria bacterium]|nr:IPTL-CTERM sorting domain-containing protein [Pseudomonadota bacterium]